MKLTMWRVVVVLSTYTKFWGKIVFFTFPSPFLYYEGKVKKSVFPQNFVYVLRTTTTRHMVSFIDFYFHFLGKF